MGEEDRSLKGIFRRRPERALLERLEGFARLVVGAGRDPGRDELGVSGSEIGRFALALSIILGRPAARPEMVQMW